VRVIRIARNDIKEALLRPFSKARLVSHHKEASNSEDKRPRYRYCIVRDNWEQASRFV